MTRISDTGITLNLRNDLDEVRDKYSGIYHMDIVYDDCCVNPDSIVECMFVEYRYGDKVRGYTRFICIAYEKEHASQSVRDIIDLHKSVASDIGLGTNYVSYNLKFLYPTVSDEKINRLMTLVIDYIASNMQYNVVTNILQVTTIYDADGFLRKWKKGDVYGIRTTIADYAYGVI